MPALPASQSYAILTSRASRADAPLLVPRPLAAGLMALYDVRHPRTGRLIRGYDRPHAVRTAQMCAAVALHLGHPIPRVLRYQIACLLHDLGRAGLDRRVFGPIWTWAREQGIPTRPREWRARHPRTRYGRETEAFVARYGAALAEAGMPLDAWAREQIEMRLGYARRFKRRLRTVKPALQRLGVTWASWMTGVVLYYYYPETLRGAPLWVRELAQVLVACEQFEAYSNRRRGRDYYARGRESVAEAFAYLRRLQAGRILSARVIRALRAVCAAGRFDALLAQARGAPLSARERRLIGTPA
jgi:hypothetical protein